MCLGSAAPARRKIQRQRCSRAAPKEEPRFPGLFKSPRTDSKQSVDTLGFVDEGDSAGTGLFQARLFARAEYDDRTIGEASGPLHLVEDENAVSARQPDVEYHEHGTFLSGLRKRRCGINGEHGFKI